MRFATRPRYERPGLGESSHVIVAMGLALAVAGIVQTLAVPTTQPVVAIELFVSLFVPTGLATGGYWLANRNVCPDVRWRITIWVSIGILVACGLGVWLVGYIALEGGSIRDPLSLVTTLAAVGGSTGFLAAVHATPRVVPDGPDARGDDGETPDGNETTDADESSNAEADTDAVTEADTDASSDDPTATAAATASERPSALDEPRVRPESAATIARVEFDDASSAARSAPSLETGVARVASIPSTAEATLEVLHDDRARIALAYLYHDRDGDATSVADLARVVADHTDDSAAVTAVSLRHATLPRLGAIRAVEWDPHADRVVAPEHAIFEEGVREAMVVLESFEPGTR